MRFRNTLILLAILIVLGGYIYFFELNREDEPSAEELAQVIFDLNVDEVTSLTVIGNGSDGNPEVRLSREPGGIWQLGLPEQAAGDDVKVTNTVQRLAELEATRVLEENPSDISIYGLDTPDWQFVIGLQGGDEQALLVGDQNPTKTGYFAQKQGHSAVYLVGTSVIRDISGWATDPPLQPTPTPVPTETPASTS